MAKNEKTFNEQNMRKIIRILRGLSSAQQQLAEQCINEYDPTRTYQKDNICFFNGSLYRAKTVTNGNEPSPESTYFEMLDGVEEEIDAQYIETLMSTVSAETWDYMKTFINDDIISGTHGYSSAKIYAEIQSAIQTAKDYTLEKVANSSTGSYVIANGTDEVVDDKHLFLISNGSNYDIYALVNGTPTKIGDTSVSLNGLLTEANAESTYLKQADATATYATITTTDGLRTDLNNHTGDTDIHVTKELKDKLVTTDDLGDYAKTADLPTPRTDDEIKTLADGQINAKMTTTINSSSTDTQVPSAKSVYTISGFNTFTEEDVKSFGNNTFLSGFVNKKIASTVISGATDHYNLIKLPWNGNYNTQIWISASGKKKAYIQYAKTDGVWDTPKMICTTTVADVAKTSITLSDETNYSVVNNSCLYFVKNGMCTMMLYIQCNTPSTSWVTVANVPKADTLNYYQHLTNGGGDKFMECLIKTDGVLQFHGGAAGTSYLATFSYPVAES